VIEVCQGTMTLAGRPTAIDLFSGAGGLSLGFEMAGFDVVGAVELDRIHAATHLQNFPDCAVINRDIRSVSGRDLRSETRLGSADLTAVIGGPPCQGFSVMGRQAPDDPRNSLVAEYARLVLELKPRYFLFETVKGFGFRRNASLVSTFLATLSVAYDVAGPVLVDSATWGLPQRRERVFILGRRLDVDEPSNLFPSAPLTGLPTVWDAITDLAGLDQVDGLTVTDVYLGELPPAPSEYARVLRLPRKHAGQSEIDAKPFGLSGCKRSAHSLTTVLRFAEIETGGRDPVSRFDRLHPSRVAPTLRAGTGPDHGSHTAARPIHPYVPRCVTVREAARLQSFPDWFRFNPTTWHGFRQIGNSVPPNIAEHFAGHIALNVAR